MKKLFLSLLIVAMMFSFVGCKKSAKKGEKDAKSDFEVTHLDDAMFKQEIFDYSAGGEFLSKNESLVVIDFYADWCGPCRVYSPMFTDFASKYVGDTVFYKANVDKNSALADFFGVNSIPTTVFIPAKAKADEVYKEVGVLSAENLNNKINSLTK